MLCYLPVCLSRLDRLLTPCADLYFFFHNRSFPFGSVTALPMSRATRENSGRKTKQTGDHCVRVCLFVRSFGHGVTLNGQRVKFHRFFF